MKKGLKILNTLDEVKNLNKLRKKFFVFDCETYSKNARPEGFAFCCMTGYNYRKVFHTIKDFQDEIFSGAFKNKYIFCHWAEFDLNVIFGNIKKGLDRQAVFNGSNFIIAQKDNVLFADSLNIYKTSVSKIGEIIGVKKKEMNTRFGKNKKFKYGEKEIDYCYTDCEIVWQALEKIFIMVQSVRPTLASLSMLYYRRFYMPFHFGYNELSMKFFDSYYGGRVEAFKIGETISSKYDINSMYPYTMTYAKFPNPKFVRVSDATDIKGFMTDLKYYEGHATLKVRHKKVNFGFLPVKKDGKLIFPVGEFSGTWCFPEIRFALKEKIIEILEVKEVLISYPMESPFKKFAKEVYDKRLKADGIEKNNLKLILNSLYGKFGQREKFKEIYFDEIPFGFMELLDQENIPYELKMFNKERVDCYLHIFAPVKINKDYTEVKIDSKGFETKIHSIPVFCSYITSLARVYLLENILKYRRNLVTYTDTDCICLEREVNIVDSLELGAFKKEKDFLIEIRGNKNYTEKINTGEINVKIKGIPKKSVKFDRNKIIKYISSIESKTKREELFKRLENGEITVYNFDSIVKTKRSLRQQKNAGVWEKQIKVISDEYTKRKKGKNGKTYPLLLRE